MRTYSSSASIDSRSSTSRKIDTAGSRRQSCRFMVAHWSWPVDQMCERNRCHRCFLCRLRLGSPLVPTSLMIGACTAILS